jgi:hypothetical protein
MALNLSRNSRVFLTTKLNSSNQVDSSGHTVATTFELQVLDGFTFSQNTNTETVTLTEAGASPSRGQRSFNTSLAPVDFSFSTYVRPDLATNVKAEESVLWGVLVGNDLTSNTGFNSTSGTVATITPANSNKNTLTKFGLIVIIDNVTYVIDNCAMNQAVMDFAIDQIATIQWSGFGTAIRQLATNVVAASGAITAGSLGTGNYTAKNTAADFLTNKLSTASIGTGTLTGSGQITVSGSPITVAITGGSVTYNNNITYLTPSNLAVVNAPITYFTGTRSITGTLSAYLRTGGTDTGAFLNTMLNNITLTENNFVVTISIGGITAPYVKLELPTCSVQIPSIDVQQVVSTSINFTAQGSSGSSYDLAAVNEMTLSYYAV